MANVHYNQVFYLVATRFERRWMITLTDLRLCREMGHIGQPQTVSLRNSARSGTCSKRSLTLKKTKLVGRYIGISKIRLAFIVTLFNNLLRLNNN